MTSPFRFDEIAQSRYYGCVTGGFADVVTELSDFHNLNRVSAAIDVFQIDDDWIPVSRDELLSGLTKLIGYDSAYNQRVVPEELAMQYALDFVGIFMNDARFYKNYENEYDSTGRFVRGYSTPLTDATFSYGFAGLASKRVGMIVVCDED